jgi:hypothetical protein
MVKTKIKMNHISEINHFKAFVLCKIMWRDVVVICQLLNDMAVGNWWMM